MGINKWTPRGPVTRISVLLERNRKGKNYNEKQKTKCRKKRSNSEGGEGHKYVEINAWTPRDR